MHPDVRVPASQRDRGSFRDPDGFIVRQSDRIFRVVLAGAVERWRQFAASGLAAELQTDGLLVPTHEVTAQTLESELPLPDGALLLEHERISFISYPYEWTFDMLGAAALLQLEIVERSLQRGWILKDSSAYNVQFRGATPLFIDVLSFAPLQEGEPWAGYNQFCRMMLYPLMLEAYKHVPFQPWLRSELEGIDPIAFGHMFRGMERFRPGVLGHVTAQAYLQRKFSAADYSVRQQIKTAGMTPAMIARNVRKLPKNWFLTCTSPKGAPPGATIHVPTMQRKPSLSRRNSLAKPLPDDTLRWPGTWDVTTAGLAGSLPAPQTPWSQSTLMRAASIASIATCARKVARTYCRCWSMSPIRRHRKAGLPANALP